MTILKQSYDFLQEKVLPNISKRHKRLFSFGFEALTIRPFVSLNGNSRVTVENRSTAQSKIYRLVTQQKMLSYFPQFVTKLGLWKNHPFHLKNCKKVPETIATPKRKSTPYIKTDVSSPVIKRKSLKQI